MHDLFAECGSVSVFPVCRPLRIIRRTLALEKVPLTEGHKETLTSLNSQVELFNANVRRVKLFQSNYWRQNINDVQEHLVVRNYHGFVEWDEMRVWHSTAFVVLSAWFECAAVFFRN